MIGRTKVDSIELDNKHKPPTVHIARVESDEIPSYRRSVPYGSTSVHGLYFVAFRSDITRFDRMLARIWHGRRWTS